MNDNGLLTDEAQEKLSPLVENVRHRLSLQDSDLKLHLPLKYEPLTDVEYDTVTYLLARAIKEFARDIQYVNDDLLLAEIVGLNDMMERHQPYTASIDIELRLEEILPHLFKRFARPQSFFRADQLPRADVGDYFAILDLEESRRRFPRDYIKERHLRQNEFVRVEKVLKRGFAYVSRLNYVGAYTQKWEFYEAGVIQPADPFSAIVYWKEGQLFKVDPRYQQHIDTFIANYLDHMTDRSVDPTHYQPLNLRQIE